MREVRMTFGEHLEELRKRVIFCVLYLIVGVGVCFIFGQDLLELTLGPHRKAIAGAQRDRLVKRMKGLVNRFQDITSASPSDMSGRPVGAMETIDWEVLFAADVAAAQMGIRVAEPLSSLNSALEAALADLPPARREALQRDLAEFSESFSGRLVEEFAINAKLGEGGGILRRMDKLEERLLEVERRVGPSKAQQAVGWGEDLSEVLGPLRRFRTFLVNQRDQSLKKEIDLENLRERVRDSRLYDQLDEELLAIEESAKDILLARNQSLMAINYLENFNAYLKVALIFGIVVTIPFLLYELWKFIGAGLHSNEQKYVVLFTPFSLALFAVGGLFGYFVMIPVGLEFLAGWGLAEVNLSITLGSYISLFFTLTLILGIVFQTPLVMIFLTKIGVADTALLRRMRRVSVFCGICLAIIMTPPDPFSWSLMAVPMIVLYEIGILMSDWLSKKSSKNGALAQR